MDIKDEKKTPMQYIGAIEIKIAGIGSILPGQTVEVPFRMANNLAWDINWRKLNGKLPEVEIPAQVAPVEIESDGLDGLDGLDNSDKSDELNEKPSKRKNRKQEES